MVLGFDFKRFLLDENTFQAFGWYFDSVFARRKHFKAFGWYFDSILSVFCWTKEEGGRLLKNLRNETEKKGRQK